MSGVEMFAAHPSRRGLTAAPQDEAVIVAMMNEERAAHTDLHPDGASKGAVSKDGKPA
jgi:hypothetical protein